MIFHSPFQSKDRKVKSDWNTDNFYRFHSISTFPIFFVGGMILQFHILQRPGWESRGGDKTLRPCRRFLQKANRPGGWWKPETEAPLAQPLEGEIYGFPDTYCFNSVSPNWQGFRYYYYIFRFLTVHEWPETIRNQGQTCPVLAAAQDSSWRSHRPGLLHRRWLQIPDPATGSAPFGQRGAE